MIIHKLAKEGIAKSNLYDSYIKNGLNGIHLLLDMSVNEQVRVTTNKKIMKDICKVLQSF